MKYYRMLGRRRIVAATAVVLCAIGTPVAAKTYTGTRSVNTSSAFGNGVTTIALSIDTDGSFGPLTMANITGWNVVITASLDSLDNAVLTAANSGLWLAGDALVASDTSLTFDFESAPTDVFRFYENDDPANPYRHFYCVQSGTACAGNGDTPKAEAVYVRANRLEYAANIRSGVAVIGTSPATTAGVPEPATWALLIVGFGAAGVAMRRRPRSQPALV